MHSPLLDSVLTCPHLRARGCRGDADRRLRLLLRMHALQDLAAAEGRRLLRVLFVWLGQMPADAAIGGLLCRPRERYQDGRITARAGGPRDASSGDCPKAMRAGEMTQFSLVSYWHLDASIERVWDALIAVDDWPRWWRYVHRVITLEKGDSEGLGSLRRYTWSSRLPYRLSFDMRTTALDVPTRGRSRGRRSQGDRTLDASLRSATRRASAMNGR